MDAFTQLSKEELLALVGQQADLKE